MHNKNREQNTNNATGANEKQMKSNTIDKRQKKKINSLPFSEKEEKFDINISNDIGKAREGQDEYLQKFKNPMPISTKEHSMNQLIKSYLLFLILNFKLSLSIIFPEKPIIHKNFSIMIEIRRDALAAN